MSVAAASASRRCPTCKGPAIRKQHDEDFFPCILCGVIVCAHPAGSAPCYVRHIEAEHPELYRPYSESNVG